MALSSSRVRVTSAPPTWMTVLSRLSTSLAFIFFALPLCWPSIPAPDAWSGRGPASPRALALPTRSGRQATRRRTRAVIASMLLELGQVDRDTAGRDGDLVAPERVARLGRPRVGRVIGTLDDGVPGRRLPDDLLDRPSGPGRGHA